MLAMTKLLAGGAAMAALASAAPAAAQYYPGYGYGYQSPGIVVDRVLNDVMGAGSYGYGGYGYGGYGMNSQTAVNQCASAVQTRLGGGYGGYGYNSYGYGGGARVLGISRVEPRSGGGLTVRGVASSGQYGGYAYGAQAPVDLTWKCRTDFRGFISGIEIDRAQSSYGYGAAPYNGYGKSTPYNYDYSQYGYRRY